MTNGPIDIRALYAEPGLRRLFEAARERLERRDLDVGGWVTIREPSADERRAIARTLGARTLPDGDLRVSLADLDATLRAAAHGLGLPEVLAAIDRPLVARKAAAAQRRAARTALYEVARSHPALVRHPGLEAWIDWIRARGLLSRLGHEDAARLLDQALDVLHALPVDGVSLPVLAGRIVGSTHALDRDQPLAQLCERALAILAGHESIDTAAERRDLWAGMGVSLDAVSSTVLVLGLRPVRGPLAGLLGSAAAAGEPLPITLRMLRDVGSLELDRRLVRICENRSIIEAAAEELGAECQPLVCTSGDPTLAGRRLLEVLAVAGADLRYHGDFDWEGIGIANGVVRAGVRPWRYDADAYLAAVSRTPIRDSLGDGPVRARWDGRLVGAMQTADARIYEEHVLDDLLADLVDPAAAVAVPVPIFVSNPETDPESWVAASRTRSFLLGDPICDWLARHGTVAGFLRDDALERYDARTDFRPFVLEQGQRFEAGVMRLLADRAEVRTIATTAADARSPACAAATTAAMATGVEIIAQGVLHDPVLGVYGIPDLLVRADVLDRLFPDLLEDGALEQRAPALGIESHYRVIDIKLHTFDLLRGGHASGASGSLPFLGQVWLYNHALGLVQGFGPPSGYLLGRGWVQGDDRSDECLDRLARIDADYWLAHRGASLEELARRAVAWFRRLRSEGASWTVLPEPTVPELYPNLRRTDDSPWHAAKRVIGGDVGELTRLPRINPDRRAAAHTVGIRRWDDPQVSAARLGITSDTYARQFDAVLAANRATKPVVLPEIFGRADPIWRDRAPVEFYVDFETVSDLADDFSNLPRAGGQELIFQIGCGHVDADGIWQFSQWTADRLAITDEGGIIAAWLGHLAAVCDAAGIALPDARIFHWSPAETSTLETAYNAARTRHAGEGWPDQDELPWFDLLTRVARAEPLTVTGAFGFGLKAIATAMADQGLIATRWADGPTNGLGAMVGAWWCDAEAERLGVPMLELDLMRAIADYNEVDCRVMADILDWLRLNRAGDAQ